MVVIPMAGVIAVMIFSEGRPGGDRHKQHSAHIVHLQSALHMVQLIVQWAIQYMAVHSILQ